MRKREMTGSQRRAAGGRTAGHESGAPARRVPGRALLLAGILVIAITLRAPLTVVGPLLGTISRHFGFSGTEAGLLNTLPLLAFAVFSPLAPRLSRRAGTERALMLAVIVLAAGVVLRSAPWEAALFSGTLALGAAIAMANTLLPALVKQHFPGRQGAMTGLYVATMGFGATVAAGVAVPLAGAVPGGWQTALGCWAGLAVPAAVLWIPQLRRGPGPGRSRQGPGGSGRTTGGPPAGATPDPGVAPGADRGAGMAMPWRSPLAWQVTAFMGLQSLGFYVMIGWLPSLLSSHGVSAHAAGWILSLYQLVNLLVSLTMPLFIDRMAGQRAVACGAGLCCAAGYLGLILAPGAAVLWVIVAGAGTGACFVLALSFMALRAQGPGQTAGLSAMAQSVGYLVAAGGPVAFGFLRDASGTWTPSLLMLLATAVVLAAAGLGAGRPAHVAPPAGLP
jgi:MFS transporter, CP family, cyanate transporter